MTRYLLDTDTMISLSKGFPAARSFFADAMRQRDELGLTAITLTEFYAGLVWLLSSKQHYDLPRETIRSLSPNRRRKRNDLRNPVNLSIRHDVVIDNTVALINTGRRIF